MVNKRGLSPEEFNSIDPDILHMLMIYDSCIEPSGTEIEMLYHAYSAMNTVVNNSNIPAESKKKIKVQDFDFLNVLDDRTKTMKEKSEDQNKLKQETQANDIRSLGEMIKKQALGKSNGK
ncbi:hypothetical protein [Erwinia persicina]|uniref:hypothetical protein n=1 Tax=Erwinia persicina TaxID=55211 RepID=UPI001F073393|nr:hypothetical protein [Erwinia persicina]